MLFIFDSTLFFEQHGGDAGANAASGDAAVNASLEELRAVAREHGLPGVFVVGGVYVAYNFDWNYFPEPTAGENYDALDQYAYPAAPGIVSDERPYAELAAAARDIWDRMAERSAHPYIPTVMVGWDPRPWNETVDGQLFWYRRTPEEVASLLPDAAEWVGQNPSMRVEPEPAPPLVLLTAWNELGEGMHIVPTIGDTFNYGQAIASTLGLVWDPVPRALGIRVRGKGSVTVGETRCSRQCTPEFAEGLVVTLRAKPARGYEFVRWRGDCSGTRRPCSILMDAAKSAVARFTRE